MVTTKKAMVALAVAILSITGLTACSSDTASIGGYTVPKGVPEALNRIWDNRGTVKDVYVTYMRNTHEVFSCYFSGPASIHTTSIHYCKVVDSMDSLGRNMKPMDHYSSSEEWFVDMSKVAESTIFNEKDFSDYTIAIQVYDKNMGINASCYIHIGKGLSQEEEDSLRQHRNRDYCSGDFFAEY